MRIKYREMSSDYRIIGVLRSKYYGKTKNIFKI